MIRKKHKNYFNKRLVMFYRLVDIFQNPETTEEDKQVCIDKPAEKHRVAVDFPPDSTLDQLL